MGGIAVPGLQRHHLAHAVADEIGGRLEPGVEALHVADLQHLAAGLYRLAQILDRLDAGRDGLFAEHVLACLERADGGRNMKAVGGGDDHRLEVGSGQHRVIVGKRLLRRVGRRHALAQVVGHVTDGIEVGIRRLAAAFEMRRLGNRPAAEHADPQTPVQFLEHLATPSQLAAAPRYFLTTPTIRSIAAPRPCA